MHYFQQVGFRRCNKKKVLYNKYFNESFENLKIIDEDESEITLNQVTTRSKALDYLSQNIYEYSKEGDSGIFKELMATVMKNKEYSKVINLMFDGAFIQQRIQFLMKMLQDSCTEIKKILELQDWNVLQPVHILSF